MSDFIDNTTVIEVEEEPISGIVLNTNNHALLENRYSANQHNIDAIEGLSDRLETIEAPKNLQTAKGKGYVEYWAWSDRNTAQEDRTGYFVSLVKDGDNNTCIEITNENNYNVFGVTASKTISAFVGNEELVAVTDEETGTISGYESTRDSSYGLVCLVGSAKVRYIANNDSNTLDIEVGAYIKPGPDGYAIKAGNKDGYYRVVGVGTDINYGNYVIINLSMSASDVENISVKHAKTADDYTENGKIQTALNNMDQKINTEIFNTENDIKNGIIVAGTAKNFDINDGSIKEEFNRIENETKEEFNKVKEEFDKIKNGDTIVAKSNTTDHIDVTNIKGEYAKTIQFTTTNKEEFEELPEITPDTAYIIEDDDTFDKIDAYLDKSYYLGKIDSGARYITGEFNIDDLDSTSDAGVYFFSHKEIQGLPNSQFYNYNAYALKLIVEAIGGVRVGQTLICTPRADGVSDFNTKPLIFYRTEHQNSNQPVGKWSAWFRFVSENELTSGWLTVAHAEKANTATKDSQDNDIHSTYAKLSEFTMNNAVGAFQPQIGTIALMYINNSSIPIGTEFQNDNNIGDFAGYKLLSASNATFFKFLSTPSDTHNILVQGRWRVLGMADSGKYLIQRIS